MTWQRIDDNTYIDDTLVTCAEYQLFIDEMREQGRYYQPDHWTSHQFAEGQAREPVLGMRPSDAIAFCSWLSNRDGDSGSWRFWLPTTLNARDYPMKFFTEKAYAYWLIDDENQFQLAWDMPNPKSDKNAKTSLDLDLVYQVAKILDIELDFASNLALAFNLRQERTLTNLLDLTLDRSQIGIRAIYRNLAYDIARDLARNQSQNVNAVELYNKLFTLQERITGRSPAFEGIRLVKERK